jgi:hypothetical protein
MNDVTFIVTNHPFGVQAIGTSQFAMNGRRSVRAA